MLGAGSKKWIGLTIEQTGIRFVRLKKKRSREIAKKCYLPLQPGMIIENQIADRVALTKQLKSWVKKEGLRGSTVALSIPPSQMIIRQLNIPSTNQKQLDQLVKLEVETALHLPFENPVYDYVEIGRETDHTRILVYATPRKLIEDYVELLEEIGIKVSSVEISATALSRAISATSSESFAETMLIHLDQTLLDVYMFSNGQPMFMRSINLFDLQHGGEQEVAASALDMNLQTHNLLPAEQLVEIMAEISRILNFYQYSLNDGNAKISEIVVTGPISSRNQLLQELKQSINDLEIRALGFESGRERDGELGINDYRVAWGAAIRDKEDISSIDLLPREDRDAQMFPVLMTVLLVAWVVCTVGVGIYYVTNRGEVSKQADSIQQLQDDNGLLQIQINKLTDKGKSDFEPQDVINDIKKARMNTTATLNELAENLPFGAVIRDVKYDPASRIDITVNFLLMDDAADYLGSLREMSFAKGAHVEQLSQEFIESGLVKALQRELTAIKAGNTVPADGTDNTEQPEGTEGTEVPANNQKKTKTTDNRTGVYQVTYKISVKRATQPSVEGGSQ